MMMTKQIASPARQDGAALIVGLLLLLVLTVFAITSMSTSTLDVQLAGNTQFAENAFQAAESAIEAEIVQGAADPAVPRVGNYLFGPATGAATTVTYDATRLAPPGYSLTEYQSDHYIINAAGVASKNASSTNEQGFYVVIPGGAN